MAFNYPAISGNYGYYTDCTDFYVAGATAADVNVQMRLTSGGHLGIRGSLTQSATLNDYAEYFEWADGNPDTEDRIGISVVLVGKKIRPADSSDDQAEIIGVVSATAGVALGAGNFEWSGKYKTDEYGRQLTSEVRYVHWQVEGENYNYREDEVPADVTVPVDAEWKTYNEPLLSDDFDPTVDYWERPQRKEWACVGLVGQIRVRKGSPTGNRWLKMRDISANVEEWFVR